MHIFTIGHSNHPLASFLELLKTNGIQVMVDVRSAPYSRYVPMYNKQELEHVLRENNFRYLFMGDRLGGKPKNNAFRKADDTIDYEKIAAAENFRQGIGMLLKNLEDGLKIALLCAEENPENCHRHHLIARELENNRNIRVTHIRADGSLLHAGELFRKHPVQLHLF